MAPPSDTMETATGTSRSPSSSLSRILLRLLLLALFDAFAIYTAWQLVFTGLGSLAIVLILVAVVINIVFLRNDGMPLRWIMPGLALLTLMHIYPVMFTVYTAFTNYSTGHLVPKQVAIRQIESRTYLPEGAPTYSWSLYQGPDDTFGLWLTGSDGSQYFVTSDGEGFTEAELQEEGVTFDADGAPTAVGEYQPVPRAQVFALLGEVQNLNFGPPVGEGEEQQVPEVKIISPSTAAAVQQKFVYDPEQDAMIDQETGKVYVNVEGTFTAEDGDTLIPGFPVTVGLENFSRLFTNPALRGPVVTIFIWTVIFALVSVLSTFALGLLIAIVLNEPNLPFARTIRVLMIVPYAIPAFISALIWRGMFNPILGVIGSTWDPGWFTDPFWAKVAILTINLWLGYAYMFLITTGALQGIPSDIYEAAKVDGASGFYQFRRITLPLLLISVGPLLIGSFAFNFNNFTLIELYNQGGPPIPGTPTPAGYTDILISYTYRLAFAGGRGADYGLASAIAIVIFVVVGAITIFNFRYTGMLEEVSENV